MTEALSKKEQTVLKNLLETAIEQDISLGVLSENLIYKEPLVGIDQFIEDDYYLGLSFDGGKQIWQFWRDAAREIEDSDRTEVALTGAIGIGKCVSYDTLVNTNKGFMTIENIYKDNEISEVQAESGLKSLTHRHFEGKTKTLRVTTKHGHLFEGSKHHKVRVLSGLILVWKRLDELEFGDCVILKPAEVFGNEKIPESVAELSGWHVAEGSSVVDHSTGRGLVLSLHESEIDYISGLINKAISDGLDVAHRVSCSVGKYRVNLRRLKNYLDLFASECSLNKYIPNVILQAPKRVICSFLRGLFSGDGYVGSCAELTSVSEKLIRQVSVLLTAFGIYCSVNKKPSSYKKNGIRVVTNPNYTVRIVGTASLNRFNELIGFVHDYKTKRLLEKLKNPHRNGDHSFSFKLSHEDLVEFSSMQPRYVRFTVPKGLDKTNTPSGLIRRIRHGQGCTLSLLREIKENTGVLPPVFESLISGELLFDTVASVKPSQAVCYDLSVCDDPSYIANGFVSHNSLLVAINFAYLVYRLMNIKDLRSVLQKTNVSEVCIAFFNISAELAESGVYATLHKLILGPPATSPNWFMTHGVRKTGIKVFRAILPEPIKLLIAAPGKKGMGIQGKDVIAGCLDEISDVLISTQKEEDLRKKAFNVYTKFANRVASRYITKAQQLGKLFLISSKADENAFLESYIQENVGKNYILVYDAAIWDVIPSDRYSGEKFPVAVGDKYRESKIINDDERELYTKDGYTIIDVPIEYRQRFDSDLVAALRDFAGISIIGTRSHKLIPTPEQLYACFQGHDYPRLFKREEGTLPREGGPDLVEWMYEDWLDRINDSTEEHYIHVDFGLTDDAVGVAMSHPGEAKVLPRIDKEGKPYEEMEATAVLDFVLCVRAVAGQEIPLPKILEFLEYICARVKIVCVTFDGWESKLASQSLQDRGIKSEILSVENDVPYLFFKAAIVDKRWIAYDHPVLTPELLGLEHHRLRKRCDHPANGSKDCADAVCGSVYPIFLTKEQGKVIHSSKQLDMLERLEARVPKKPDYLSVLHSIK